MALFLERPVLRSGRSLLCAPSHRCSRRRRLRSSRPLARNGGRNMEAGAVRCSKTNRRECSLITAPFQPYKKAVIPSVLGDKTRYRSEISVPENLGYVGG